MKFQTLTLTSILSLFFIGCNDDVGSNRGREATQEPQRVENLTTYSGIHRNRGSSPMTYSTEIALNSSRANVRRIPDIQLDDEGGDGKNVITRTVKIRPTVHCGQSSAATLREKIADCNLKNGETALWDGSLEAGSSEGIWKLITLSEIISTGEEFEVWLDERTGMVWSDIITTEGNWCEASGNQQGLSDTVGVDCLLLSSGKDSSLCTNLSLVELPKVFWRLPTRNDYLQADLDGIRFVLKRGSNSFWTATISSDVSVRDKAWAYNMVNGTLIAELIPTSRNVRCIGTTNF